MQPLVLDKRELSLNCLLWALLCAGYYSPYPFPHARSAKRALLFCFPAKWQLGPEKVIPFLWTHHWGTTAVVARDNSPQPLSSHWSHHTSHPLLFFFQFHPPWVLCFPPDWRISSYWCETGVGDVHHQSRFQLKGPYAGLLAVTHTNWKSGYVATVQRQWYMKISMALYPKWYLNF